LFIKKIHNLNKEYNNKVRFYNNWITTKKNSQKKKKKKK
jgi:hypothetical protein